MLGNGGTDPLLASLLWHNDLKESVLDKYVKQDKLNLYYA